MRLVCSGVRLEIRYLEISRTMSSSSSVTSSGILRQYKFKDIMPASALFPSSYDLMSTEENPLTVSITCADRVVKNFSFRASGGSVFQGTPVKFRWNPLDTADHRMYIAVSERRREYDHGINGKLRLEVFEEVRRVLIEYESTVTPRDLEKHQLSNRTGEGVSSFLPPMRSIIRTRIKMLERLIDILRDDVLNARYISQVELDVFRLTPGGCRIRRLENEVFGFIEISDQLSRKGIWIEWLDVTRKKENNDLQMLGSGDEHASLDLSSVVYNFVKLFILGLLTEFVGTRGRIGAATATLRDLTKCRKADYGAKILGTFIAFLEHHNIRAMCYPPPDAENSVAHLPVASHRP